MKKKIPQLLLIVSLVLVLLGSVLALDMYDHGHSAGNADNTGSFLNFWPSALYDAASYRNISSETAS